MSFEDTVDCAIYDEGSTQLREHDMTIPYFILIAFNLFVIAPVILWLTIGYCKKRHKYRYSARRPTLVIFYNLFALFFVGIYIPLHIVFFEILWDNNNTVDEWWDSVSYNSMLTAVNLSLSLRIWHSFYDFQLAYRISQHWKSILTERLSQHLVNVSRYQQFLGMLLS